MRAADMAAMVCRSGIWGCGLTSSRRHTSTSSCQACITHTECHLRKCCDLILLRALEPGHTSSPISVACMYAPSSRPAAAKHRTGTGVLLLAACAASSLLSAVHAAADRSDMSEASRTNAARETLLAPGACTQACSSCIMREPKGALSILLPGPVAQHLTEVSVEC